MVTEKKKLKYRKFAFNAIGVIVCAIAIPLLLMNLVLIIKGNTKPTEVPSIFNLCPIIESSDLMTSDLTNIKNGDLLIFHTKNYESLNMGETDGAIVAIKSDTNTNVMVRRLISSEVNAEGVEVYTAISDNKDPETSVQITRDEIIGVFTMRLGGVGKFILFSQTTVGIVSVVIMPIVILLFIEVMLYIGDDKKEKEKKKRLQPEPEPVVAKQKTVYIPNYVFEDVVEYEVFLDENGNMVTKKVI